MKRKKRKRHAIREIEMPKIRSALDLAVETTSLSEGGKGYASYT